MDEIRTRTLRAALALIGFTAVVAQIVLMRELMVVFRGNELSLGLILATWLIWTAVGSGIAGRWGARFPDPRKLVASLEVVLSVAFPLSILAVRASKQSYHLVPGEIPGPGAMLLTSLVTLSLFCVVSGWLFAAGSRLYARQMQSANERAAGSVYLLEAAGSAAGGLLAGLVLIRYLGAFEIASLLALLNLLAAVSLTTRKRRRWWVADGLILVIFGGVIFPVAAPRLEKASLAELWHGFHLIAARNSIYGNLAVVGEETSRTLFENGLALASAPDEKAAEEAVHYALLEHPSPKSLLLIGGGVNGSFLQALRHPGLERVDYVELDPEIIALARRYFSKEWNPAEADPRAHVHLVDGRLFLRRTNRRFDVIDVNLPDPQTAQLNRFYTLEFFREAARKLAPGGVLSFQLKGSENYISEGLAAFLRCIDKTLGTVFPEVVAMPGNTIHFFAAKRTGVLTADPRELISRLRARHLQTLYVREYYLPFRMAPDRMKDLETQIRPRRNTRLNRDFAPVAYYFDMALWSTLFHTGSGRLLHAVAAVRFRDVAGGVGLLLLAVTALLSWLPGKQRGARASAGFCVAAMGFTMIGLEMLLLLAFQAIYGYVYQQLAIVIAGFMVGMALGSWLGLRDAGTAGRELRLLVVLQMLAAFSGIVLYLLFTLLARVDGVTGLFLVSQIVFPGLAVLCGLLGGYQFPLVNRIYFTGAKSNGNPGTPYALDLAGSCLGAIVLALYLVPVFGFLKTGLLMGLVNLAAAVTAGLSARRPQAARR